MSTKRGPRDLEEPLEAMETSVLEEWASGDEGDDVVDRTRLMGSSR